MAVVPNGARVPKRWKLTLLRDGELGEADEYQGHTSAIEWPSNQSAYTWRGGDDNTITDLADGDQLCNVTVAQDTTEGSLYRVMWDHAGERATLQYWPEYDGDFGVTAQITLMRPPLLTNRGGAIVEHTVPCPSTEPTAIVAP